MSTESEIVELMENDDLIGFKTYAQTNINWRSVYFYDERFTLLHLAVCHNKPKFVKWMLESGLDINSRTKSGDTALHLAIEAGAIDCMKELLVGKPDTELEDNIDNVTPLIKAIRSGQTAAAQALITSGASLESKDRDQNRPLHIAIDTQQATLIDALLDKGANVEAVNYEEYTPIHMACRRSDMVKRIIKL
jgi:ankyrin repeat protein